MALPVSLEDARAQLRMELDDTSRDAELSGFIADAAGWVESYTGLLLTEREITERFAGFAPVALRAWPIAPDAAVGVAYLDAGGSPVSSPGSRIDATKRPARVFPPAGAFWPFRDARQQFTVTVRAGYADPADVPRNIRRAMLLLIGAYDDDREGGETLEAAERAAASLCRPFKAHRL